jgi:hypothetical protein
MSGPARRYAIITALVLGAACGQQYDGTTDAGADADSDAGAGDVTAPDAAHDSALPLIVVGCADGTRETFVDPLDWPRIAGCAGGFSVAGVTTLPSLVVSCGRHAGNDGPNPNGQGCSVTDLCAAGWHVCVSTADFAASTDGGACDDGVKGAFWLTRQAESAAEECAADGRNNLVGCGTIGSDASTTCKPFDRQLLFSDCASNPPWHCGDPDAATNEADLVVKNAPAGGGVLCCRD